MKDDRLLKLREVIEITSLSKSSIYELIGRQSFPAAVKVGRSARWKYSTVLGWIDSLENEAA